MARLSSRARKRLPKSKFAIPSKRKYPIDTIRRARNALSRVAQHGTPSEKSQVRRAVKRNYPSINVGGRRRSRSTSRRRRR